ncbi:MAG: VWA domain-containing protein [Vicinamibacterales bacterium]
MGAPPSSRAGRALFAAVVCAATVVAAQEPQFRGGTNLVRLDVYVSANGAAVTDLTADDFEVLEDRAPQTVTSFEFVRARGVAPESARVEPSTVAAMRDRLASRDTRAFVLFLDTLHVQVEGSYRAANPVATLLDRVVGADDLVGVMTPEMTARNMTFSPRTGPVGDLLRTSWAWGERGGLKATDPRESDLQLCYPDGRYPGIAKAIIERRREQATMRALRDLIDHLEGLRDQRTFVLLLTEGWLSPRPDQALGAPLAGAPGQGAPSPPAIGVTPTGTLGVRREDDLSSSCERERQLLAYTDFETEFRQLTQRANRANVSFYPIDARGLVVFDDPIGPARPASPSADRERLQARQTSLRVLAEETDGAVVLNTAPERALPRLLTDIGSYYLLGYVSTNQALDGRYRRLTVRVKRPGVEVRARPGYLAPTAREVSGASGPVMRGVPGASSGRPAESSGDAARVTNALARLPVSRTVPPLYADGAGSPGGIDVVVELDRTTVARPEWQAGGVARVVVTSAERPTATLASVALTLAPGARVQTTTLPTTGSLPAGRYQVRVEAVPDGGTTPALVTTLVDVPAEGGLLGSALRAARRGPSTGRAFEPTADVRYRRTERLRLDVARVSPGEVTARLLNATGQTMAVPVTITDEPAAEGHVARVVADLTLAPLAAGEYVIELVATSGERRETRTYAFRLVP